MSIMGQICKLFKSFASTKHVMRSTIITLCQQQSSLFRRLHCRSSINSVTVQSIEQPIFLLNSQLHFLCLNSHKHEFLNLDWRIVGVSSWHNRECLEALWNSTMGSSLSIVWRGLVGSHSIQLAELAATTKAKS